MTTFLLRFGLAFAVCVIVSAPAVVLALAVVDDTTRVPATATFVVLVGCLVYAASSPKRPT